MRRVLLVSALIAVLVTVLLALASPAFACDYIHQFSDCTGIVGPPIW